MSEEAINYLIKSGWDIFNSPKGPIEFTGNKKDLGQKSDWEVIMRWKVEQLPVKNG